MSNMQTIKYVNLVGEEDDIGSEHFKWHQASSFIYNRGWVFLERTQILSGIQLTRHSVEFVVVETKQFIVSNVNVILTRQTCGQRSSMLADSKRKALTCHVSIQMYYMFLISGTKWKGKSDQGLMKPQVG